jgi:glutamate 5-kinase
MRESGSSLLAVGVTDVDGSFQAGDAVWVIGEGIDGPLGKGISEYSSGDVLRAKGRNSAYLREHHPNLPEEVIHRDRFVLS